LNPDWIFPGMWIDPPVNRHLPAGAAKDLLLIHDFTVTGGQSFSVIASWDNTSGSPDCASNTVTVVRP
jgi:hypothetical protein